MKKIYRDIILILLLLLIAFSLFFFLFKDKKEGERVVVTVSGKVVGEYSLKEDSEYSINDGSNVLVIRDGKAYMERATCPNKECIKMGEISLVGESITCLPNRVVVTVNGSSGYDYIV